MNRNAPGNKEFRVGPKCWLDLPKGVVGGGGGGCLLDDRLDASGSKNRQKNEIHQINVFSQNCELTKMAFSHPFQKNFQ